MRVLILAKHLGSALGGIEIQCELLARQLVQAGHAVFYGAAGGGEELSATYPIEAWTPGDTAQTLALIQRTQPDVIYLRHNKIALRRTARCAARAGVPLVFAASSLQDVQAWSFHRKHVAWTPARIASVAWQRVKSRWNWSGFRWVSAAVSLNPDYTQRLPVERRRHIADAMESIAEPFQWPRRYVAWVAQLKDYKNPGDFVELARRSTDLDIDFLMAGEVVSARYEWIAKGVDVPSDFHYLGRITPRQVNGLLQSAAALVHTCDPEGFGNNFIQAWQQGTPTLSLRFDPAGIIERERLGAVPGDMDGLERALRALLADEDARLRTGERARAYARVHHDPATTTQQLVDLFQEVIAAGGAR